MLNHNIFNPSINLIKYLKAYAPDDYYIWPMAHLGDKSVFFSFLDPLSKLTGKKVRILTFEDYFEPLISFFPCLKENTIELPKRPEIFLEKNITSTLWILRAPQPTPGEIFFTWANSYSDGALLQKWQNSNNKFFSHTNFVRHIFGLPNSVKPTLINIKKEEKKNKSILIAPFANYKNKKHDLDIFIKIAKICRKNNYLIIWNFDEKNWDKANESFKNQISNEDEIFFGEIHSLIKLALNSKIVISARSGFCELLSLSNSNYITVNQEGINTYFWNLENLGSLPIFEIPNSQIGFEKFNEEINKIL